jgi:Flp pilus assembly protein CpaB
MGAVLALVGFIGVVAFTTFGRSSGSIPVVVAAKDIPLRTQITADDLTVLKFTSDDVPAGSYSATKQVVGQIAAVDFAKGQPILGNLVSHSADNIVGGATSYLPIPSGFVAVTIPTGGEIQSVAGYIQPGDYVTLIATLTPSGAKYPVSRTVFTNLHVIRVGPAQSGATSPSGTLGGTGTIGVSSSLTVVVTECDAEYLRWLFSYAVVSYTLESDHDYVSAPTQPNPSCASVTAAKGVTGADVQRRWPGLLTGT